MRAAWPSWARTISWWPSAAATPPSTPAGRAARAATAPKTANWRQKTAIVPVFCRQFGSVRAESVGGGGLAQRVVELVQEVDQLLAGEQLTLDGEAEPLLDHRLLGLVTQLSPQVEQAILYRVGAHHGGVGGFGSPGIDLLASGLHVFNSARL